MFGFTAAEMQGQIVHKLVPASLQEAEQAILHRVGAGQIVERYQTIPVRKDGELLEVDVNVSPVRDAAGEIFINCIVCDSSDANISNVPTIGQRNSTVPTVFMLA